MARNAAQLSALTGIRGFAACWVMFFHFAGSAGVASNLDLGAFINMGAWGVEVFFVLSGFVLSFVYYPIFAEKEKASIRTYLLLRLARIYPLHLAVLAAYLFLIVVSLRLGMGINSIENFGWADGIRHLLLIHAWGWGNPVSWNPVAWSISAEWFAYLFIMPLTVFIGRLGRPLMFLALCLLAWLGFYVVFATDAEWNYLHLYKYALLRVAVDFSLGAALYQLWRRYRVTTHAADAMWILATLGIVALTMLPAYFSVLLLPLIALMIYGLAGNGYLSERIFSNSSSIYLGDISYSIYMIHPLVLVAGNLLFKLLGQPEGLLVGWVFFIAQSLLAIALSVLTFYVVEDPMRRWVRGAIKLQRHQHPKVSLAPRAAEPTAQAQYPAGK